MAMRSQGGYAWCDHCERLFASSPSDKPGTIRHPTTDDWPGLPLELSVKINTCPNAGKLFRHPVMEEVSE
jgi:hypothetical protein